MDKRPKQSLEAIKKRERDALKTAQFNTRNKHYGFLRSGIFQYDQHIFPGEKSVFEVVRAMRAAHPDRPVRVLDFGCGANEALRNLAHQLADVPLQLTGVSVGDPRDRFDQEADAKLGITFIDIDANAENDPKKKPRATFVAGEGEKYDLIMSRFALQHIPDIFRVVRGLYRSLQENGQLYLHIGEAAGSARFAGLVHSEYGGLMYKGGAAEFMKVIDGLIADGIQIEKYPNTNTPEILVIHKSKVRMRFPTVHYDVNYISDGRMYRNED